MNQSQKCKENTRKKAVNMHKHFWNVSMSDKAKNTFLATSFSKFSKGVVILTTKELNLSVVRNVA